MYLQSLELQGFKSFPNKIKLEFDKGLTAVVGPNGSGKSNISDAVRWVLGEQSSKTLRGAKMEDVIFSGTIERKPVGFASVTLNIVNDKGLLQIPSEQVSITRKLHRSGESEYLINGVNVRLKDVSELFMDTGLGRDGYSVIGQGRIAEIISAKSGERREIFEEAAGISKFRYKKAEAERRLVQAEENLLRLRDIATELENRIAPLKEQSEKATLFLGYADKKKILEISVFVKQLDGFKFQLEELSEKILISQNDYNNIDSEITRIEDNITQIHENIEQKNLQIERLRAKILEITEANTTHQSDIAVFENDMEHSKNAISDIEKQRELSHNSKQDNLNLIEQKTGEIQTADENIAKTAEEYKTTELRLAQLLFDQDKAADNSNETNNELNKLYIRRSELSTNITTSQSNIDEINAELSGSGSKNAELKTALIELKKEKSDTKDALELAADKSNECQNRMTGMMKLHETRLAKYNAVLKDLDDVGFEIRDKEQRIRMLKDLENNMEGVSNSVKAVIKASERGQIKSVRGSVAQIISVEEKYATAIEIALGAAMQNLVVADDNTAKRCIEFLKESKAGRATFLPLTTIKGKRLQENGLENNDGFVDLAVDVISFKPEYTEIFTSLLGRTAIAEDLNAANVIAKKYGYRFKIVTLDGQVINAGGSFTGGSVAKSAGILTRKNEIEKLQSAQSELLEKQKELTAKTDNMKAENDKMFYDIEGVKETIANARDDKVKFEAELKRIDAILEQTQSQLDDAESSKERLNTRLSQISESVKTSAAELEKCNADITEKEKLASENEEKRANMHTQREELSAKLSSLKLRETELQKDKQSLLKETEQLKLQIEQISENTAKFDSMQKEQEESILERQRLIEERRQNLANSSEIIKGINGEITTMQGEMRTLEQTSNEDRKKVRELSASKEERSKETSRLEERRLSVQQNIDTIIADMEEQYGIYQTEAAQIAEPIDDLPAAKRELDKIKRQIKDLGDVYVAAIDEYKEVSERYKFLSEQLSDVETSKRELERLISELTDNMRKMFSESFEQINENFKVIFAELFGGGFAELSLSDPDDVLESGIDIRVAPPGKVINNLSLLSGGEQAFAAIAIYFSILKIKPAPFCILDEIEAALDDVNVVKYARYLRRFTDTTQFVLVTHRRGTMEEADVMYGVTMQDKGVSKVLKMDNKAGEMS